MDELAQKLNITDHTGWYMVTNKMIQSHGAKILLTKHKNSMKTLLTSVYPKYQRDNRRFD